MATTKSTDARKVPASSPNALRSEGPAFVPGLNKCDQITQHACDRILALTRAMEHAIGRAEPRSLLDALALLKIVTCEAEMLMNDINCLAEEHGHSHYVEDDSISSEIYKNFREAGTADRRSALSSTEGATA